MTRPPRKPARQGTPEDTAQTNEQTTEQTTGQVFFSASDLSPVTDGSDPPEGTLGRHSLPATSPLPVPGPAATPTGALPSAALEREPKPAPLPSAERRHRARFWAFLRVLAGFVTVGALAYFMWTGGEWQNLLLVWVFLTIFADEFGGWFGYAGLLLGGLGYVSPNTPPEQWLIVLPLVGGALMALLLVKHAGGPLVLPFAGLLFAGTLLAVARYGLKFDPQLKLPANDLFLRSALLAAGAGLALSFVRQIVGLLVRRQAHVRERRAEQAALLTAAG